MRAMINRNSRGIPVLMVALALAVGCRREQAQIKPPPDPAAARPGKTMIRAGKAVLWVEIVDDPRSRELGLMYRRELPGDEGMLFVFEQEQPLSFWMRNTYIPLDIAFADSRGVILNILQMKPLIDSIHYNSKGPARYAIEMNQGWFAASGVAAGDTVRFDVK